MLSAAAFAETTSSTANSTISRKSPAPPCPRVSPSSSSFATPKPLAPSGPTSITTTSPSREKMSLPWSPLSTATYSAPPTNSRPAWCSIVGLARRPRWHPRRSNAAPRRLSASTHAPQRQQRDVVLQLRLSPMPLHSREQRARKIRQLHRLRQSPQRILRQRQKSFRRQLLPLRRVRLSRPIRKRQNHVLQIHSNTLLVVLLAGNETRRQSCQPLPQRVKPTVPCSPHQHPGMRRIREIEL